MVNYTPGGEYLHKTGDGYVRAIKVPFFIPQKSLKGVQNHKLVSERGPKSISSLSKGLDNESYE